MNVNDYLSDRFPNVQLVPSIYYQWNRGIHFSLGGEIYQLNENDEINHERFSLVFKQISTIFNELFELGDDLFLVTNVYKHKAERRISKLKVYKPYLKCKNKLKQIQVKTYPYPFELENDNMEMQQFSLLCKREDIRVNGLLKAASNEDFPLKPKFGGYSINYPDVFLVNITKDIIFFIYDDRGCEVIAREADHIRSLYEKYYEWVDDEDRKKIEKGLDKTIGEFACINKG